jgi:hypothetical protein
VEIIGVIMNGFGKLEYGQHSITSTMSNNKVIWHKEIGLFRNSF